MISIVIPSYNQQEYLCDAIESVLNQTYKDLEIIVVDDGSTDNSLAIAKSYEPRIKVVSQVNKGLPSARNTGIMNTGGQYVLFLDADDILLDNCVEKIVKVIENTNADIVSPSFKEFGVGNANIILRQNLKLEDFKNGNMVGCCSCVRRTALLEVGGYSPRMVHGYEDYHLWINLLSKGKILFTIPEVLWLYRTKEHSMIHDAKNHHNELISQINKDFHLW